MSLELLSWFWVFVVFEIDGRDNGIKELFGDVYVLLVVFFWVFCDYLLLYVIFFLRREEKKEMLGGM